MLARLRHAVRGLGGQPGSTLAAVSVMACAIGSTSAVFSVFNAVYLQPLPYHAPERLYSVSHLPHGDDHEWTASFPEFERWRHGLRAFEDVCGVRSDDFDVSVGSFSERVTAAVVTDNCHALLGIAPVLGRGVQPGDARSGHERIVVLGERLWRTAFQSDPHIIGRTIRLENGLDDAWSGEYEVVGVFDHAVPSHTRRPADLWLPHPDGPVGDRWRKSMMDRRNRFYFETLIARLRPGFTPNQTALEVGALADRLEQEAPIIHRTGVRGRLVSLHEREYGGTRHRLSLLLAAVALMLTTACINLGALLLASGTRRSHELAVRASLGATRARLCGEIVAEHAVLGALGGAGGLALAQTTLPLLRRLAPADLPRVADAAIDVSVLLFLLVVTALCVLIFGLLPAVSLSSVDLGRILRPGRDAGLVGARAFRRLLVGVEIALSGALLVGTGLATRSLWNLSTVPLGFDAGHVLAGEFQVPTAAATDFQGFARLQDRILNEARSTAGVDHAALMTELPANGTYPAGVYVPEAGPQVRHTTFKRVSAGYFDVFRIPVLAGRVLRHNDRESLAVVVNDAFARRYYPRGQAVGRSLFDGQHWREIVGVVADARETRVTEPPSPTWYVGFDQATVRMWLAIRLAAGVPSGEKLLRDAVGRADATLVVKTTTLGAVVARQHERAQFFAVVLAAFGIVAVALVAIGVYAMAYQHVAERRHEFGVRMALGANRRSILTLVLGQVLRLAVPAAVAGLVMSHFTSAGLSGLLFGLAPSDPTTMIAVAGSLVALSVGAAFWPALAAASVDPVETLRNS